jgi:hypothetical protein
LRRGVRPRPYVGIWPRGGGKSTSAEIACGYLCHALSRRFVLFVSGSQEQADRRVINIERILGRLGIERALNQYGHSRGWRRQELRTAIGFAVASFGLDAAARGVKIDNYRPDLIVMEDVDDRHDTARIVDRKLHSITDSVLPTGSPDCAVAFLQNLVHAGSIASMLLRGSGDLLLDHLPISIEPAICDLEYERIEEDGVTRYRITGGTPTWGGQDIAACENYMSTYGRLAFLREMQHAVDVSANALWTRAVIETGRRTEAPEFVRAGVGVDPPGGVTECGIVAGGVALCACQGKAELHAFVTRDDSLRGSPAQWGAQVVSTYGLVKADRVWAERNFGGDMVQNTIRTVPGGNAVAYEEVAASRGKQIRAEPIAALYERGMVHHVGHFPLLEDEMCSWEPGGPSPNRMDALVWLLTKLMLRPQSTVTLGSFDTGGARPSPWRVT